MQTIVLSVPRSREVVRQILMLHGRGTEYSVGRSLGAYECESGLNLALASAARPSTESLGKVELWVAIEVDVRTPGAKKAWREDLMTRLKR